MIEIQVRTSAHRQMLDITPEVRKAVQELGTTEGEVRVFVPHTTAAIVINESADPDVQTDLLAAYEAMIPGVRFRHAEGNSDAHLLSTLLGSSVAVPIKDRRLRLGTWQGIFFVELDGPRTRRVFVNCVG